MRANTRTSAGFTLLELLVVMAVIAILIALLVSAVQRVRAAAARIGCDNNLKQLGLATANYVSCFGVHPPGSTLSPSQASVQLLLLPYLEQGAKYREFDLTKNVFSDPNNYNGRIGDIPTYLCPADPSAGVYIDVSPPPGVTAGASGRCNYVGNAGAHGWWKDASGSFVKPMTVRGIFGLASATEIKDIMDGTSKTALFAEVKRGAAPKHDTLDVTQVAPPGWGPVGSNPGTNTRNLSPPAACNSAGPGSNLTGLQYYRGTPTSALYTHTVPPNYGMRDCIYILGGDQFHLAARSYHSGGVNVCLVDGSVRFVSDGVGATIWRALGTRAGGETDELTD